MKNGLKVVGIFQGTFVTEISANKSESAGQLRVAT